MYTESQPEKQGFEISWRIFGIHFRVHPTFFLISALIAYLTVGPNPVAIAIDVGCIFFAIVFTEFVQGLVYRSYGLRSTVVIQDFFGGIYPEAIPPTALQRIVVALANPASSFLLYFLVDYSDQQLDWKSQSPELGFAYFILKIIAEVWGIIGLIPVFPYSGGRVVLEVLSLIFPKNGIVYTLVISIALALSAAVYVALMFFGKIEGVDLLRSLPGQALLLIAVLFALCALRNWQLLSQILAMRKMYRQAEFSEE